jgi:hypothetical protein
MSGSDEQTKKIQHDTAIGSPPRKWSPLDAACRDCLMETQHRRRIFIKPA